jgi:hypothetical protein
MKSKLRVLLVLLFVGALGAVGFFLHQRATEKDRHIEEQKRVIAALELRLDRTWAEELVADVRVDALARTPTGASPR